MHNTNHMVVSHSCDKGFFLLKEASILLFEVFSLYNLLPAWNSPHFPSAKLLTLQLMSDDRDLSTSSEMIFFFPQKVDDPSYSCTVAREALELAFQE